MRGKRIVTLAALVALVATASAATYVVERGDTLWRIAQAHGTTVAELVQLNGISNPNLILVGQELKLPQGLVDDGDAEPETDGGPASEGSPQAATYRVQRGDTLYRIARQHGTTVAHLVRINSIPNPNLIRVGQVLKLTDGASASAPTSPAPPSGSSSNARIEALLTSTARAHGLDPALVKAVAWQESRWRPNAVSPAGARGVMQVMPSTGRWISSTLAGRSLDLDDPADNILAGVLYLAYLDRLTGGNEARTLASYFQGPNAVARNGISSSGQRYVSSVRTLKARFT